MSNVEAIDFVSFPERVQKLLKTHTEEGKIRVKTYTVGGRDRPFIDADDVIERLNDAFGHAWSDEIIECKEFGDEVAVHVRVSVTFPNGYRISHDGWGSQSPRYENTSKGDVFKSAHTGAIKAAAKKFGIGLHMEANDSEDAPSPAPRRAQSRPAVPQRAAPQRAASDPLESDFDPFANDTPAPRRTTSGGSPSDAQLGAIHNMTKRLNVSSPEDQAELMQRAFDASDLGDDERTIPGSFKDLTKKQASAVISYCISQVDNQKTHA